MVQAVRGAQAWMQRLLQQSLQAMEQAQPGADTARRLELVAAQQLLQQHRPALLKGYGLALLETFGQPAGVVARHPAPSSLTAPAELLPGVGTRLGGGGEFASLSLVDDAALQVQLAHHRLLQSVAPQVEIALAELDALVSAVQGLERVQPERNPLRPQNYVRALQRVIDDTGISGEAAACWTGFMREYLGALLVSEYSRMAQALRDQGVEPAAYGLAQPAHPAQAPLSTGHSRRQFDGGAASSRWRAPTHYGDAMSQSRAYGAYEQQAQEEDLALRLARHLLSDLDWMEGRGEAVEVRPSLPEPAYSAVPTHFPDAADMPVQSSGWGGAEGLPGLPDTLPEGWTSLSCMALDSVQGAQLEQLMQALQAPLPEPVAPSPPAGEEGLALHTLQRMMRFMSADERLLPGVRRTVHLLEPMLQQLVVHDARFFEDRNHPARLMLDELTARSLWFSSESSPGYSHFLQVADLAVVRLAAEPYADAAAFGRILLHLREGWAGEASAAGQSLPPAAATGAAAGQPGARRPEASMPRAEQIAAAIRRLPSAQGVPEDILDFATGPWAEVIARAQGEEPGMTGDPGGYLALVPSLLWSVSPNASRDTARLVALAPRLQSRLRAGLRGVGRSEEEIQAFAARLAGLHQDALDSVVSRPGIEMLDSTLNSRLQTVHGALPVPAPAFTPVSVRVPEPAPASVAQGGAGMDPVKALAALARGPESLFGTALASPLPPADDPLPTPTLAPLPVVPGAGPAPSEDWVLGTWAELCNARQSLRTQLTWVSPQQTLFLFTAADGSTQSMTRRMRDKLLAQGHLRKLA